MALLLSCFAVSCGTPSATPRRALYWGAWIGRQLTGTQPPGDMSAVAKLRRMVGKPPSLVQFAAPFARCGPSRCSFYPFPAAEMTKVRRYGAIPFFSWASQSIPSKRREPAFQLSDVIRGAFDAHIRRFAIGAKHWGDPFFLRFNHEMNGNWFPWSERANGNRPGQFVAAWRHVHRIFASVGADNAAWVWCPYVDPAHTLQRLAPLYPGDSYVDWTCLDGYNWGTNPRSPRGWFGFDRLFNSSYHEIADHLAPTKPMVIGEFGSTEYGGSKSEWIANALHTIPVAYPRIRAVLWFEQRADGMDWPIETSAGAVLAFARGIGNPAYAANSFGAASGVIRPPSR